jgi:hypothetical protein
MLPPNEDLIADAMRARIVRTNAEGERLITQQVPILADDLRLAQPVDLAVRPPARFLGCRVHGRLPGSIVSQRGGRCLPVVGGPGPEGTVAR